MSAENKAPLLIAISLLVIVASATSMVVRGCNGGKGSMREAALTFEEALGTFCGETVARHLEGSGTVVLLEFDAKGVAALDTRRKSVLRALEAGGIEIAARATIPVTSDADILMMLESGYSRDELERVRAAHPDADAILSLAGAPAVTNTRIAKDGPPLIVAPFTGFPEQLHSLARAGVLKLAIVRASDPEVLLNAGKQPNLPSRVKGMYKVFTP